MRHVATSVHATGWRRPIGCLKMQVIVCKRATNSRVLLRKMTLKIRNPMSLRHSVFAARIHLFGACICVRGKRGEDKREHILLF